MYRPYHQNDLRYNDIVSIWRMMDFSIYVRAIWNHRRVCLSSRASSLLTTQHYHLLCMIVATPSVVHGAARSCSQMVQSDPLYDSFHRSPRLIAVPRTIGLSQMILSWWREGKDDLDYVSHRTNVLKIAVDALGLLFEWYHKQHQLFQ